MGGSKEQRLLAILGTGLVGLLTAAWLGVMGLSLALSPAQLEAGALSWLVSCPFGAAGTPCPTCGLSRSFSALSHLDPGAALAYHPAGPVLYLAGFAGMGLVWWSWSVVLRPGLRGPGAGD